MKSTIRPVARFVTRCDGTMFVGTMFRHQKSLLPDHVYEIKDVFGQLMIEDKGKSIVPEAQNSGQPNKLYGTACWGSEISHVLACFGKHLFLTADEYNQVKEEDENDI